jgi:hypothetical protein
MEVSSELEGIDFEWFATDLVGNLALFVSAGGGYVPQACYHSADAIESVSRKIPTPHMGSGLLWSDYGAAGLYVYDWTWPDGPYGLIQYPTATISSDLRQAILQLPALPKIGSEFDNTKWVEQSDIVAT